MKIIEFIPARPDLEGVFDPPIPAKTVLPEWYKEQSMYTEGQRGIDGDGNYNHTVKACMPALDAMSAGYIIPLPQDIEIYKSMANQNTSRLFMPVCKPHVARKFALQMFLWRS